jgi:hypothetical protein
MRAAARNASRFSLKEYIVSLDNGSRCFACGCAALRVVSDGQPDGTNEGGRRLVCPGCGSAVTEVSEASSAESIGSADSPLARQTAA